MDAAGRQSKAATGVELSAGRDGSTNEEPAWRWPGWRAPARAEVVGLGLLATLALLLLAFGGAGSQPLFSSSSSSSSRSGFVQCQVLTLTNGELWLFVELQITEYLDLSNLLSPCKLIFCFRSITCFHLR
jgi:hypothetical protein